MDKYQQLYVTRLEQWQQRVQEALFASTQPLSAKIAVSETQVAYQDRKKLAYSPITKGQTWGKAWDSAWFHVTGTIAKEYQNLALIAKIDLGGEGLIFDKQGVPTQSLSNRSAFLFDLSYFKRQMVHLGKYIEGDRIELWIEGAANELFGVERPEDPALSDPHLHGQFKGFLRSLEYTVFDQELWDFIYDLDVLVGLLRSVDEKSARFAKLLSGLMDAAAAYADRRENLARAKKITDTLLSFKAVPSATTAFCIGHAHIDTAWLWPVSETIRKCARTFSSQVDLLERYPDYVFGASAPQHFQYTKDHYPVLYKKISKYVQEGRWELQGGMWIEADCNLPSGESLIRQFIHGKNFFKDEFDVEVDNLWIPDVFGYSAALPQIMKKSGVNNFLTQKISWSQFNDFPHHSFIWQGIDGSEVLTHFPPEDTYNSLLAPDKRREFKGIVAAEEAFVEKALLDQFMVLYGVGDGGGGPTDEMIERGRRLSNIEGAPKVKFGTAKELFKAIATKKNKLKKWVGELYLEYHRGTLTTQAKVKWYNRKIEFALQEFEKLAVLMTAPSDYPRQQLDRWWKTLLLNQFHDIIPGSSIHKVYQVCHKEYEDIVEELEQARKSMAQAYLSANSHALTIFNQHSYDIDTAVTMPADWLDCAVFDDKGKELVTQGRQLFLSLAQHAFVSVYKGEKKAANKAVRQQSELLLENQFISYQFDNLGRITSIYDKEKKRQVLTGLGNVLTLYEDRPHACDAWDIDAYYENCIQEVLTAKKVNFGESGAVSSSIEFEYQFGSSKLMQKICLGHHSKRLEFHNWVDWNERHSMLRVHFELDIRANEASYDIQYGYLKRATHRNTSWDKAKFEVCGHKYADLSEMDYGVALLNDSKYGYKVFGQVMDLALLRSPTHPDPVADRGEHQFSYALLPHIGGLIDSQVMKEATDFNQPARVFAGLELAAQKLCSFVTIDNNSTVSLDVVKRGEKDEAIYLRLVERNGIYNRCLLKSACGATAYVETDMLEWKAISKQRSIDEPLSLKPFEIKTIKLLQDS